MADIEKDIEKDLDTEEEIFNDEEYQKALDALNSSKSSRLKDAKKKKAAAKKAVEGEPKKKDPIVIACCIGIAVVIIGAILYFVLPSVLNQGSNLGFKTNEIQLKYEASSIYSGSFGAYSMKIPEVTYSEVPDNVEEVSYDYKYFNALVDTTQIPGTAVALAIEGRELNNGMVKQLNAVARIDPNNITDDDFSLITLYYACMLQTLNPELTDNDAVLLVTEAMGTMQDPGYYVYNNVAYRIVMISATANDPYLYVKMEFINAEDVGEDDTIIAKAANEDSAKAN